MSLEDLSLAIRRRTRELELDRDRTLGLKARAPALDRDRAFDAFWENATPSDFELDDLTEREIDGLRWALELVERDGSRA